MAARSCGSDWLEPGMASTVALARTNLLTPSVTEPGGLPSLHCFSKRSVTDDALKKSLSSRWKMRNSSMNSSG